MNNKGITLIEIVFAMSILGIFAVAIVPQVIVAPKEKVERACECKCECHEPVATITDNPIEAIQ